MEGRQKMKGWRREGRGEGKGEREMVGTCVRGGGFEREGVD